MVRSRPRSKKGHQNAPKSAPSWPSWPPSWPSWAHLGAKLANLAPSWPILAPRCAPIAIQMEPQMRHTSHLGPSWRQEGHRGPQKCSWSLNFHNFFLEFWTEFDRFFKQLSSISSRRFGTVAAWRAQRTGYPPPPRSGWSGVCKSGVQSCQFQFSNST